MQSEGPPEGTMRAFFRDALPAEPLKAYPYAIEAHLGLAQLRLDLGDAAGAEQQVLAGLKAVEDPNLRRALEMIRSRRR